MDELATMDGQNQVDAVAALPRDMAIIKMENDNIMALAAAHPRDYAQVLERVRQQVKTFPSFAREAVYAKPVGKDYKTGKQKYARGLSIRAAEALAEAYRYNRVRTDVTPIDDNTVRIEATFVDYQTGRTWQDAGIVSKLYKDRNGKTARHSDERFYNVVVKAEASRRIRECILRCIPSGLRSALMEMVDEQVDSYLDDSTVDKIIAQFSGRGVDAEQLEAALSTPRAAWDKGHRSALLEMWNALDTGETTKAEMFGPEQVAPDPSKTGQTATEKLADEIGKPAAQNTEPLVRAMPLNETQTNGPPRPTKPEEPITQPEQTVPPEVSGPDAVDGTILPIAAALGADVGDTFGIEGVIKTVNVFKKFHIIVVADGTQKMECKRWTQGDPPEWCVTDAKVRMSIEVKLWNGRKQFEMVE